MDLRSRKPFRRKKTLEIVLHDIPEDPKAGFGGTKIFETVLYDTPVPRKAPTEGQNPGSCRKGLMRKPRIFLRRQ